MSIDKFGRFYMGSLDKFGRYNPYGVDAMKSDGIVGKPLETPKPQNYYSETNIALYGANNRYSDYRNYTNKTGMILDVSIPKDCTLFVDEIPVTLEREMPIKNGAKIRLYKRIEGNKSTNATINIKVKSLVDEKELTFKDDVSFRICKVFRFLQDSGEVTWEHLPSPTVIFINGINIGHNIVGRRLIFNDVLSFYPPNGDRDCEIFFIIKSPIQK